MVSFPADRTCSPRPVPPRHFHARSAPTEATVRHTHHTCPVTGQMIPATSPPPCPAGGRFQRARGRAFRVRLAGIAFAIRRRFRAGRAADHAPRPFHARRGKPAYVPPHARNRPAGQRDGGSFGRDDRRGGTSPDAGAPHFFRPTCSTCLPPQSATETKCRGCDFPFFRLRARRDRARSAPAATPSPDATRGRDATHRTRTLPRARVPMPLATSPCVGPSKPKRARKRACGIGTSLCVSWLPEGRSVSVGRLFF